MRMSLRPLLGVVAFAVCQLLPSSVHAEDLMVYKVSIKIVAAMVVPSMTGPDTTVKKKLGNNDIVNLALGRPLGTKVDGKTEILAGAGNFEPRTSNAPIEKLIVFDPSQNGIAQVKATVGVGTSFTYQGAYGSKATGFGFGSGMVLDTVLGDPSHNGFISTALNGSATGAGAHLGVANNQIVFPAISGVGTMSGPIKFNYTDKSGAVVNFDGIIVKGQGKVSGKPIGAFTE